MNNTTTHQTKETTTVFRLIKRGQEQGRRRRFLPCIPSLPRSFRFRRIDLGISFSAPKSLYLCCTLYVYISGHRSYKRHARMPKQNNQEIPDTKKKGITRFAPAKNKEIARGPCTTLDMCTYLPITYYVCVCVCVRRTTRESY